MGKHWIGIAVGIVVGVGLAIGAVSLLSSKDSPKKADSTVESAKRTDAASMIELDSGTRIEFVLLQPLHSGDARVGETAEIVVLKDVVGSNGQVAVPVGKTAKIQVVRSREGSAMSSLVNQPARLEIRFLDMGLEGDRVKLVAERGEEDSVLELTRESARTSEASAALKSLWQHEETQKFLSSLADRLNGVGGREDFDDPDSRRILADVASELGLEATQRIGTDGKSVGSLLDATETVAKGRFDSLNSAEALLAIQAISELGRVASGVDKGLRGAIKGRNIKIPIGTKLTAYVAEDVKIARR